VTDVEVETMRESKLGKRQREILRALENGTATERKIAGSKEAIPRIQAALRRLKDRGLVKRYGGSVWGLVT